MTVEYPDRKRENTRPSGPARRVAAFGAGAAKTTFAKLGGVTQASTLPGSKIQP